LVIEFSFTKEIEDRLLAPLPVAAVAVQKMLIAALRGVLAGLFILPLGALILPGGLHIEDPQWLALIGIFVFGSLAAGGMGLVLGTAVPPNRISVAFAVVLTPLIFTGCTFYPWHTLSSLRWFQILTLLNPITYVSEGLRSALTTLPHLGQGWIALGIVGSLALFGQLGHDQRAAERPVAAAVVATPQSLYLESGGRVERDRAGVVGPDLKLELVGTGGPSVSQGRLHERAAAAPSTCLGEDRHRERQHAGRTREHSGPSDGSLFHLEQPERACSIPVDRLGEFRRALVEIHGRLGTEHALLGHLGQDLSDRHGIRRGRLADGHASPLKPRGAPPGRDGPAAAATAVGRA